MSELVDLARRSFEWIDSVGVEAEGGRIWLELGEPFDDLYAGTAGILFGAAEAAACGVDVSRIADDAVGRLVYLAQDADRLSTMPDDGVFGGRAGVPCALRAWSRVSGDPACAEAAALVEDRIAERVIATADDRSQYTDLIYGDVGLVLILLDGTSDIARRGAEAAADRLVAVAEDARASEHGLQWRMIADYPLIMPGFSHGSAGAVYALTVASRALDRPDLYDVAVRGAEEILALGDHPDGWAVPLSIPSQDHRPPVNFGWCHGAAGTLRMFLLLNDRDPQPRWQRGIDGCLQALRDSRVPERLYPGYWDNVARCCGTAGVGESLLDVYQLTGDIAYLDWTDVLAADVIARTVVLPDGVAWSNYEHTKEPPDLAPEPGLMQGAVGVAAWLARLDALHTRPDLPRQVFGVTPPWL